MTWCCSIPRIAAAGSRRASSERSPCRSISRWSASAAIPTSWSSGRPTVERRRHRCSTETPLPINFRAFEIAPFPCAEYMCEMEACSTATRVSTDGQSVDAQVRQLTEAGCKKVFREVASGAKSDRAQLCRVLDHLQPGDVLTVTRLDRLARSTRDLLNTLAAI